MNKIILFFICILFSFTAFASQENGTHNRFVGQEDAPITIYEFSAIGCPFCADLYHDVMPAIKENYVEKGIVKIVFMDMPFNSPVHLLAHSLLYTTNNNEDFFQLLSTFFKSQDKFKSENHVITYAKLAGISDQSISNARDKDNIKNQLVKKSREYSETLDILGTPTLFITRTADKLTKESTRLVGKTTVSQIEEEINKLIN